jgi:acetoin utilization deacetylase AcuC-like enzyme
VAPRPAPPPSLGRALRRALRRQWRRLRRRLHPPAVSLVHDPGYERALAGVAIDPLRADRILAFLADERLVRHEEVSVARPAALKNLLLVHSPDYLEALQQPATLTLIFGVDLDDQQAERLIDLQRLQAGGTIQATRLALAGARTAVNLGGGYHHAEPARGMGFCIFNDVAVAIARLRARGFAGRVLVVDLDLHDGNGTRAAFAGDATVHTLSIHNRHWGDTAAVESTSVELGPGVGDDDYLSALRRALPPLVERFRPELVFYVAGCDVADDDPLGDWRLSAAGVLARDRFVVESLRQPQVPIVVVLGGGYGDHAWSYTARFLSWLLSGAVVEPPDAEELTLLRFRQIRARLDPRRLTQIGNGDDWELTEDDLVGIVPGVPRQTRFLGYYSRVGLELMLERFGILEQLRARGFRSPTLQFELEHPLGPTLRIWGDAERAELLVELRVNRSTRALPGHEVLVLEWLLLQNPRLSFDGSRPRLPGQSHPGLGLLREFFSLLVVLCETLELDGVLFAPSTYHVADLGARLGRFVDPRQAALFGAMRHALAGLGLDDASGAVAAGRLVDARTEAPVTWPASLMVVPVSPRLRAAVAGPEWERAAAEAAATLELRLLPAPAGP